jgi:hypothetical protein
MRVRGRMEVSRKDIYQESIIKGSFLKVPIESYLELLGIEAIPSQRALLLVLLVGGKEKHILVTLLPNVSPSYRDAMYLLCLLITTLVTFLLISKEIL